MEGLGDVSDDAREEATLERVRLAWFTPWPPQPSGVAGRSAELIPALAARGHACDVFVDARHLPLVERAGDAAPEPGDVRVQSAHDFLWRHVRGQYDLVIYQAGNSRLHDYLWPYLFRVPGLTVLHDARLHHARARTLLDPPRRHVYPAEFAFDCPAVSPDAAELAVYGFDGAYYYLWPMVRAVAAASRLVAAHTKSDDTALAARLTPDSIAYIPLGYRSAGELTDAERADARRTLGLSADALVFGIFGGLSADKRVSPILQAFARLVRQYPNARLLVAGSPASGCDVRAEAATLGIAHALIDLGVIDDEAFARAIACADVSLNLRWPTAVETSGPWLQALASGRPTVIVDHAHLAHVPALDPHDWRSMDVNDGREPVTIAIDILDEAHSLGLALERLAADASLRARLGAAARRYWAQEHTLDHMVAGYERALARAVTLPPPTAPLPSALAPDPLAHTRALIAPFGDLSCALF